MGTSSGAEAALLCGAYSDQVAGVVAFAPSDVVWAGYDQDGRETSHWTYGERPLPYVPFDWHGDRESPPRFRPLYESSRRTFADRVAAAKIPVELIEKVVLVAGGDDQVWPSVAHAKQIERRRADNALTTTVITAADAGHRTILPGEQPVTGGITMHRGGTEDADRGLGVHAWEATTTVLTASR